MIDSRNYFHSRTPRVHRKSAKTLNLSKFNQSLTGNLTEGFTETIRDQLRPKAKKELAKRIFIEK